VLNQLTQKRHCEESFSSTRQSSATRTDFRLKGHKHPRAQVDCFANASNDG